MQKEKRTPSPLDQKKGVHQGDTISSKPFTALLESVFQKLNWDVKGIKIDEEYLNHLRFVDDIVITDNV